MTKIKNKKGIINLGKKEYQFYLEEEEKRYLYLCGMLDKKEKKIKNRVEKYDAWKQDIVKKYEGYPIDALKNFQRYLQNLINLCKPIITFNQICASVIFAFFMSSIGNVILNNLLQSSNSSVVGFFLVFFSFCLALVLVIKEVFYLIRKYVMRDTFLADYKAVIDEIVDNKFK